MKPGFILIASVMSLPLAGCSTLQQAALLYSSKSTVGIDVSTPSGESPGGSITIGVRVVDIAYVPVAVSQKLQDSQGRDIASEIVRIEANFGEGVGNGQIDKLSEEDLDKIGDLLKAMAMERSADKSLKTAEAVLTKQQADLRALERAQTDPKAKGTTGDRDKKIADLTAEIAKQANSVKSKQDALKDARASAAEAAAGVEIGSLLRTDKRDAMSVYGRFDSTGSAGAASAPSASLTAGKIFSTGVASQNLTEAARLQAATTGLAVCLDSLRGMLSVIPDAERVEMLKKYGGACSAVQSKTGP